MENLKAIYEYNGIPLYHFENITSTNTALKEWAALNPTKKACVFLADEQSFGRGRLGKSFISNKGGIYISLLIRDKNANALTLTTDTAVKLCHALEELMPLDLKIKWVNDIYLNDKKLSGILTEGVYDTNGEIDAFIIGIGLNLADISHNPQISEIATSLAAAGYTKSRKIIVKAIIDKIYDGRYGLSEEYVRRSMIVGKKLTVNDFNKTYLATALRIEKDLSLTVMLEDGSTKSLKSADVSIRLN
jgi:BirA family biotin operon repressor/biotin-[acetyl-CoA-carboxylase] ligase